MVQLKSTNQQRYVSKENYSKKDIGRSFYMFHMPGGSKRPKILYKSIVGKGTADSIGRMSHHSLHTCHMLVERGLARNIRLLPIHIKTMDAMMFHSKYVDQSPLIGVNCPSQTCQLAVKLWQYTMSIFEMRISEMNRGKTYTFKASTAHQPSPSLSENFQPVPQEQCLFCETCHHNHSRSEQDWALDTNKANHILE